jgi:hypothetical protein
VNPLAELFPAGAYRFHLSLKRDDPGAFFRPQDPTGRMLAERRHWLATEPDRHAAALPAGLPLIEEFAALAADWADPIRESQPGVGRMGPMHQIGARFEPDILFLALDAAGQVRLQAGTVCFPSGWSLEEKLGHPLDFIHAVVPGLNAALGAQIHQFLSRLRPGTAYVRANWGLAASSELNLHPARRLPAPGPPVLLERLWMRVEHQVLFALPRTRGIVFGIRIALHRLDEVAKDPAGAGLREALETMPPDVAAYKRLDAIRDELIRLL